MTDAPAPPINIALDGFAEGDDPELAGALSFMIEQQGLLQTLVTGIVELVPDTTRWRLTLTGDMISTVNRVTERADDNPYTTDRGAGHAGAITLPHDDGTFDIVVSVDVLFATREDVGSVEALVAHVIAAAEHLSRHEAGHAALRLRGEDADAYQDVQGLSNSDAACRKPLAAHVDDNRIEQYTALHAPSPLHHVDHLTDAIAHLRAELNEAKRTWRADIGAAAYRTLTAANGLVRVLAYLAPELGLDENGTPRRPDPLPDGWADYVEDSWDAWSLTFHRLRPVDEPMTTDQITVPARQSLCLIGPNGAGKTTLLNIVAGDLDASAGSVAIFGADATSWGIHRRARAGVGKVFQIPSLFAGLSPAQNLALARSEALDARELPESLRRFESDDARPADALPLADRRALELAVVLVWGPRVIILDEPAAGLSHEESVALARLLRCRCQRLVRRGAARRHRRDRARRTQQPPRQRGDPHRGGQPDTIIGADVSIGHAAVVHGCVVEDGCLIGMNATVLNGAVIGANSLVAAGAVVLEGTVVPPRSLVAGIPGKVRRELTDEEVAGLLGNSARYVPRSKIYRAAEV